MKVTYKDHMGDDLGVVNAARVSFGKESKWVNDQDDESWFSPFMGESRHEMRHPNFKGVLSKADQGLISFLARGCTTGEWDSILAQLRAGYLRDEEFEGLLNHIKKMPDHWTPFGHTAIKLHIKAPLFVARQLGKHQVGFVWNEVSRRYITDEPEFYVPDTWRKAAENVKQGSSDEAVDLVDFGLEKLSVKQEYKDFIKSAEDEYSFLIRAGVCPEQARMVLPQSMYTEWIWTGNLYGFANVYNQRTDPHAQKEVRDVAHQIGDIIEPLFPVSWKELTK